MKTIPTKGTSRSIDGFCAEMLIEKSIVWPAKGQFWSRVKTAPEQKGARLSLNTYNTLQEFRKHICGLDTLNVEWWVKEYVIELTDSKGTKLLEDEWKDLLLT